MFVRTVPGYRRVPKLLVLKELNLEGLSGPFHRLGTRRMPGMVL